MYEHVCRRELGCMRTQQTACHRHQGKQCASRMTACMHKRTAPTAERACAACAGRVKTLHPGVHGGLLARRDLPGHMAALDQHGIGLIDLVRRRPAPIGSRAC